jgi:hypothetical protein
MPDGDDDSGGLPSWLQELVKPSAASGTGTPTGPPMALPAEESAPRPSIGDRMAGRAPKPAPAPVDTNPAPAMPSIPFDASKLPPGIAPVTPSPTSVPRPPTGSNNPTLPGLLQKQAELGEPINRQDPKYKMGIGERLRGLASDLLVGAGGHPELATPIGPGTPSRQYGIDESMRQARLANVGTQIQGQEKLDTENQKMYEDAIKQAYDAQLGAARIETADAATQRAEAAGETADVKQQLAASQEELNKYKSGNQPPTNEFSGWYQAFKAQNKRAPSPKEIQDYEITKARAGKDTSAADVAKAIQIAEYKGRQSDAIDRAKELERTKRYAEIDKDVTTKYDPKKLAAAKQKVDDDLDTKYGAQLQKMSDEADKMLGLTKAGAKLQSGAGPAKAPAKPTTAPPAGRVWVYDKKSGKIGHIPSTQLKQATSGANAQYGTW